MVIEYSKMLRLSNAKSFKRQKVPLHSSFVDEAFKIGKEEDLTIIKTKKCTSEIKAYVVDIENSKTERKTSISHCIESLKGISSQKYDFIILQRKINGLISKHIGAEMSFMAFPTKDKDMMYVRVVGDKDVGPITFSIAGSILQNLMASKHSTSFRKLNEEHKQLFKRIINIEIKSILLTPICFPKQNVVAFLICIFNKKFGDMKNKFDSYTDSVDFNESDEKVVKKVFESLCPIVIRSISFHKEVIRREKRLFITKMGNTKCAVSQLGQTIVGLIKKAKCILCAEKCSFFIIDVQRKVAIPKILEEFCDGKKTSNLVLSTDQDVFAKVISSGVSLIVNNIKDRENRSLFSKGLECFKKQSNAIFFPIKSQGELLAIGGFSNKIGDRCFTKEDQELCSLLAKVIKRLALGVLLNFLRWN